MSTLMTLLVLARRVKDVTHQKVSVSSSRDRALEDTTNQHTANNGKRQRKPSEKIAIQSRSNQLLHSRKIAIFFLGAEQQAEKAQRLEQAHRKAKRTQRNAPDTEDEDVDDDMAIGGHDDEEEDVDAPEMVRSFKSQLLPY
jgi:hypothetical protein